MQEIIAKIKDMKNIISFLKKSEKLSFNLSIVFIINFQMNKDKFE
jgi:hypothetical protein